MTDKYKALRDFISGKYETSAYAQILHNVDGARAVIGELLAERDRMKALQSQEVSHDA